MLQRSTIGGGFRTYAIEDAMVLGFVRAATMMFSEATVAAHRPAPELQPPLAGGILRRLRRSPVPSPRRLHSSPTPSRATRAACAAAPRHPHAACVAALRRAAGLGAVPRRLVKIAGERERIEEKGYGREREEVTG
jgi:hypothetical protein